MITNNTVPAMPAQVAAQAPAPVAPQPVPQAQMSVPVQNAYTAPAAPAYNAYAHSNPAPVQGYGNPYQNQNNFKEISEEKFKEDFMSKLPEGVTAEQALHKFMNTVGEQSGVSADTIAQIYNNSIPEAPKPVAIKPAPLDQKTIEQNVYNKVQAQNAYNQTKANNQTYYSNMQNQMRQQGWTQQMINEFDKVADNHFQQQVKALGGKADFGIVDISKFNFDKALNQVHAKYSNPQPVTGALPVAPHMATNSAPVPQTEGQQVINHLDTYFGL